MVGAVPCVIPAALPDTPPHPDNLPFYPSLACACLQTDAAEQAPQHTAHGAAVNRSAERNGRTGWEHGAFCLGVGYDSARALTRSARNSREHGAGSGGAGVDWALHRPPRAELATLPRWVRASGAVLLYDASGPPPLLCVSSSRRC